MKAQFTILSGARAGQIDVFGQTYIGVGRHPWSDLRFDADQDLQVSARHASVSFTDGVFVLRDLDSTNGTLVNGERLRDDHILADQDEIQFGAGGPKVRFSVVRPIRRTAATSAPAAGTQVYPSQGGVEASPPGDAASPPPSGPAPALPTDAESLAARSLRVTSGNTLALQASAAPPSTPPPPGRVTTRIRIEVARQTATLKRVAIGLFSLLVVVTGAYFWQRVASARALEEERTRLLSQVDSLIGQIGALSADAQSLHGALDSARANTTRLRASIDQGHHNRAEMDELRRQLALAIKHQQALSTAARIDATKITTENQDAVALLFVQFQDGHVFTGSGFAVRSDASGGLLLTNRHVVIDSAGNPPLKIGVVFNGSAQNFRAELVKVHPKEDVALIHVFVAKGVPTVRVLNGAAGAITVGQPVAVLGYPLGIDLPMGGEWNRAGVAVTLTLGTASRLMSNLLQIDGYGAEGSSGSPVFNRNGEVVALVYGGQRESNGRIVFSVPVKYGVELLEER
jgi:S1-C subfamily serine protease